MITGKLRGQGINDSPSWAYAVDRQAVRMGTRILHLIAVCRVEEAVTPLSVLVYLTASACVWQLLVLMKETRDPWPRHTVSTSKEGTEFRKPSAAPDLARGRCPARVSSASLRVAS